MTPRGCEYLHISKHHVFAWIHTMASVHVIQRAELYKKSNVLEKLSLCHFNFSLSLFSSQRREMQIFQSFSL
jgi:hypothetical protein